MKHFIITIENHIDSEFASETCIESSKKVGNNFNIDIRKAIVPEQVNSFLIKENIQWTYPDIHKIDFKSGLTLHPYVTKNKNARIACGLSHYLLWKECAESNEPYLILEHDSMFIKKLNYDYILDSKYDIIGINDPRHATRKSNIFYSKIIDSKVNTRAHRDKKLCDFFIAGAYRPYMVINQRYDYCSLKMLKEILLMGVRSVYIDVFNSSLNENAFPIVTTGIKKGEWKLGLNSFNFEDVCVVIASTVFSNGYVNNFRDPFILCLNLNTNGNVKCLNRIKKTLYKIFRSNLLSNDYMYHHLPLEMYYQNNIKII